MLIIWVYYMDVCQEARPELVRLCCVTMTPGPGTAFATFNIPPGAKCAVCGSGLSKSRG